MFQAGNSMCKGPEVRTESNMRLMKKSECGGVMERGRGQIVWDFAVSWKDFGFNLE